MKQNAEDAQLCDVLAARLSGAQMQNEVMMARQTELQSQNTELLQKLKEAELLAEKFRDQEADAIVQNAFLISEIDALKRELRHVRQRLPLIQSRR